MKIQSLVSGMKLASRVSNPSSLAALYKSAEIGADRIRACSEFGNIEIVTEESGLSDPALIDCSEMQVTLNSLSPDEDIYFSRTGDELSWSTESGEGSWPIVKQSYQIPEINHGNYPWQPPQHFAIGLKLAGLSLSQATVSIGAYGVVLQRVESELKMMSFNDDTQSVVIFDESDFLGDKVTLRPPVHAALADVLMAFPDCMMDITDKAVFVLGDGVSAEFPLIPDLDRDLLAIAERYSQAVTVAEVNAKAIQKTLRRVTPDEANRSMIEVSIRDGDLILRYKGTKGRSEEILIANGLESSLSIQPLWFPANLMMPALEHCNAFCLDYMNESRLVMLGQDPLFQFIVSGKKEA